MNRNRPGAADLLGGMAMIAALLGGLYLSQGTPAGQASPVAAPKAPYQMATFAGGCFWSIENAYDSLPGVISATSGYSGGKKPDPSYAETSTGTTGHAESVRVVYDPRKVSYQKLLDVYWRQIDPTVRNRQFFDAGTQYRTIIFYHGEAQKKLALASKAALEKSHRFKAPIVTEIKPAAPFYAAEAHHQDYARRHAADYRSYRIGSGRDEYFRSVWGTANH